MERKKGKRATKGLPSSEESSLPENQEKASQLLSDKSKDMLHFIEDKVSDPIKSVIDDKEEIKKKLSIGPQLDTKKFEVEIISNEMDDKQNLSQESALGNVKKSSFKQQWNNKKDISSESRKTFDITPEPTKQIVNLKKERDYKIFLSLKDGKGILLERTLKGIANKFKIKISCYKKTGSERNVFYNQRRIAVIHEPPSGHKLDKVSLELLSYGFNKYVLKDFNVIH